LREGFKQLDLSTSMMADDQQLATGLVEAKITCNTEDKAAYLYYFVKRYPGRTLVRAKSHLECAVSYVSIWACRMVVAYCCSISCVYMQVFTNTIDVLKRLRTVMELLGVNPICLHASMQQRYIAAHF
jgi:ATP-dependent RNA helicase DDX24/MAK5